MVQNSSAQITLYIFLKIFVVAENHIAQTGPPVCKIIAGKYTMWTGEEKFGGIFFCPDHYDYDGTVATCCYYSIHWDLNKIYQ